MDLTTRKRIFIIFIVIMLVIITLATSFYVLAVLSENKDRDVQFGVTFSKKFAQQLKLDWKEVYTAMLDELDVKYIRIPTYWEDIEPQKDSYFYDDIDWQINEAAKRDAKVILVLGRRQPRWPECHEPKWVEFETIEENRTSILENIAHVVDRYKNNPTIEIWQVENEPFLDFFGECPKMTKDELQEEIDLVRSLDDREILITDSGELSTWYPTSKMGDLFGTTLYRITWNKYIGYFEYFFMPASFYRVKAYILGRSTDTSFVAELQAEPWFPSGPLNMAIEDHYKTMNSDQLIKNAEYAKRVGFDRAYFWGVEWWYWLMKVHEDDSVWRASKIYFQ